MNSDSLQKHLLEQTIVQKLPSRTGLSLRLKLPNLVRCLNLDYNMCVSIAAYHVTIEVDIISNNLVRVPETRLTFDYDLTAVSPLVLYVEDKKVLRY